MIPKLRNKTEYQKKFKIRRDMLDELDGGPKLDAKDCEKLNAPISLFELTDTIERSPKGRSPGLDGLPFEVYPPP
jgi:hypothetical protein